jgi:hypothetical protein
MVDTIVSLDERFADFAKRYAENAASDESKIWYDEATSLERELFPDGPPF